MAISGPDISRHEMSAQPPTADVLPLMFVFLPISSALPPAADVPVTSAGLPLMTQAV